MKHQAARDATAPPQGDMHTGCVWVCVSEHECVLCTCCRVVMCICNHVSMYMCVCGHVCMSDCVSLWDRLLVWDEKKNLRHNSGVDGIKEWNLWWYWKHSERRRRRKGAETLNPLRRFLHNAGFFYWFSMKNISDPYYQQHWGLWIVYCLEHWVEVKEYFNTLLQSCFSVVLSIVIG